MISVTSGLARIVRRLRRLWIIGTGLVSGNRCPACGIRSTLIVAPVLWPQLIAEWELSAEWVHHFDEREGTRCGFCHSSLRDRQLAEGIIETIGIKMRVKARSLRQLCRKPAFRELSIAEINAAGTLHKFLQKLPNLHYSEFNSGPATIPSENLMALSYPDDSFDLVITSETLEHVPDVQRALKEIRRVLKPGGWHVFSVPVHWGRKETRRRASLENGDLIHHFRPSHHGRQGLAASDYLVFYEFGSDFIEVCVQAGFDVRLVKHSRNPALVTFLAEKPADSKGS